MSEQRRAYEGFPDGVSDAFCQHAVRARSQYDTTARALAAEVLALRAVLERHEQKSIPVEVSKEWCLAAARDEEGDCTTGQPAQDPKAADEAFIAALTDAAGLASSEAQKWASADARTAAHWEHVYTILAARLLVMGAASDGSPR